MFDEIYKEIKHPYTEKNLSYKIFKYARGEMIGIYIIMFIYNLISFRFKLIGNMSKYIAVLEIQQNLNLIFGSLIFICFLISIIFIKKL